VLTVGVDDSSWRQTDGLRLMAWFICRQPLHLSDGLCLANFPWHIDMLFLFRWPWPRLSVVWHFCRTESGDMG